MKIRVIRSRACCEPDGHDHLVGVGADALQRHDLADPLPQPGVALAGTVLQGDRPAVGHKLPGEFADRVERERGDVRHAAGQRDHLGPGRHGEQGADLGGLHGLGPGRVLIDVRVQPLPLIIVHRMPPLAGYHVRVRAGPGAYAERTAAVSPG